jgi:hypothetical protein
MSLYPTQKASMDISSILIEQIVLQACMKGSSCDKKRGKHSPFNIYDQTSSGYSVTAFSKLRITVELSMLFQALIVE